MARRGNPRNLDEAREDSSLGELRLVRDWALVWGVALASTSHYLYNFVQTQAGPSTVRVRTPALSPHAPHRSALAASCCLGCHGSFQLREICSEQFLRGPCCSEQRCKCSSSRLGYG